VRDRSVLEEKKICRYGSGLLPGCGRPSGETSRSRFPGGSTMAGLLAAVGEVSEEAHQALFGENGELQGYVILMHNGRRVRRAEVETLALADGDEVALFPPVAGG